MGGKVVFYHRIEQIFIAVFMLPYAFLPLGPTVPVWLAFRTQLGTIGEIYVFPPTVVYQGLHGDAY
jgi:hypothetical protein